jgi:hypothetical protein
LQDWGDDAFDGGNVMATKPPVSIHLPQLVAIYSNATRHAIEFQLKVTSAMTGVGPWHILLKNPDFIFPGGPAQPATAEQELRDCFTADCKSLNVFERCEPEYRSLWLEFTASGPVRILSGRPGSRIALESEI